MKLSWIPYAKNKKPSKPLFRCVEKDQGNAAWIGTIPRTPLCTHFLYCLSLSTAANGEVAPPKVFDSATHEIRFGYRLDAGSRPLSLLYVAQYDFRTDGKIDNWIAEWITYQIGIQLLDKRTHYPLLLRPDPNYWDVFIANRYEHASGSR